MRTGLWILGALGDVATTVVVGLEALARGLAPSTGLVSSQAPFSDLDLVGLDALVVGGHDVREGSPLEAARNLARGGVIPTRLVEELEEPLRAYAARIRPGVSYGCGEIIRAQANPAAEARRQRSAGSALATLREDLRRFRQEEGLEQVVVVALASTEPKTQPLPELETAAGVLALIKAGGEDRLPASCLYALAALEEGCPYINFTPSLGSSPRGIQELALLRGIPHMGNDGKTGQTLLRTVLAPMFLARNLNVLSWSGFNILGNRDGEVLGEPLANAAKTEGKDSVLSRILGDRLGTSLTRIDYVPSLEDWKTAWDYVHFEGFLGTRMQLEFTWRGADSALAAPLVIDLARFIELAARRGRRGLQQGLACFFKTPLGVSEYAFPRQMSMLEAYAAGLRDPGPAASPLLPAAETLLAEAPGQGA